MSIAYIIFLGKASFSVRNHTSQTKSDRALQIKLYQMERSHFSIPPQHKPPQRNRICKQ
ncbi:MAG TPA: hypothetical protein VK211_17735 [Kamptonema sp.]|nr:hypothetical protein [Kamptonema sp.]